MDVLARHDVVITGCPGGPALQFAHGLAHERLPGSRLVVMAATGHCPNRSAPAETVAAIEAFR